jgi:hypothetical protein
VGTKSINNSPRQMASAMPEILRTGVDRFSHHFLMGINLA